MYAIMEVRLMKKTGATVLLIAAAASASWGQGAQSAPATRAMQLPLSANQYSEVSAQQTSSPSPGASVNTVNTRIQVQGAYTGSVADPNAPPSALDLTLADAVRRGLQYNLGMVGTSNRARQAEAQRLA